MAGSRPAATDLDDLQARHAQRGSASRAGYDGAGESKARGLAQPPVDPGHGPKFTEETHLADRDGARRDGPVPERAGERDGQGQVQPGFRDLEAAGELA